MGTFVRRWRMADGGIWADTRDTWYGRLCFADCVLHADGGMWFTSICRAGTDSDEEWTDVRCDERDRERESERAKASRQAERAADESGRRTKSRWLERYVYIYVDLPVVLESRRGFCFEKENFGPYMYM